MGTALTPTEKMRRYRRKMRGAGLHPVQIWVPDAAAPGFIEEARAQSLRVSIKESERDALDFIESLVDLNGWE
jgi:hypothetical protein